MVDEPRLVATGILGRHVFLLDTISQIFLIVHLSFPWAPVKEPCLERTDLPVKNVSLAGPNCGLIVKVKR